MLLLAPNCDHSHITHLLPIVCRHGNLELVTLLLNMCQARCYLDFAAIIIKSPLWVAVKKGNAQIIKAVMGYLPQELDKDLLGKHLCTAICKDFGALQSVFYRQVNHHCYPVAVLPNFV